MSKIECTHGPASTPVGGNVYDFVRDEKGRYVATVHNEDHVKILTSVEHYRRVDDDAPAQPAPAPVPAPAPAPAEREVQTITADQVGTVEGLPLGTGAAETTRHPLDHDGDGRPGGSLPKNPAVGDTDITRINGIGPGLKTRLHEEADITTIQQIAELTDEQVAILDTKLNLHGRIVRDRWVEKAREIIAAG